jgi:ATP-dependent Lon protease
MEVPDQIGVMILSGVTLFPHAMLPLHIFEPRYRRMLEDSLASHRLFCVAMRRSGARESPEAVAGLGLIRASVRQGNGTSNLFLQGLGRVALGPAVRYQPYRVHRIASLATTGCSGAAVDRHLQLVKELIARRIETAESTAPAGDGREMLGRIRAVLQHLDAITDPGQVADMVAGSLLQEATHRQTILETADLELRLQLLAACLGREMSRLSAGEGSEPL